MNNEKIEVSAKSVEAAVKKGLEKLGLAKEEAEWEILQEAGFLRHCKILIGKKPSQSDLARLRRKDVGAYGLRLRRGDDGDGE